MIAGAAPGWRTPTVFHGAGPEATRPPEARGLPRDGVRLLVSAPSGHSHHIFRDLPRILRPGDLLVVNDSATLPASLPARPLDRRRAGERFLLNLSTRFGERLWLAEPRRSAAEPGPLALRPGDRATAGERTPVTVTFVAPHPGTPRLWFVTPRAPLEPVMAADGVPIRYGYLPEPQPLDAYQTLFARAPGSAEMPSAGRPFTRSLVAGLGAAGVDVATLTLHTGVSSLELPADAGGGSGSLYAEPFTVPAATAAAVRRARRAGGRVIAVGTTVVRALETAAASGEVRSATGFSRRFVRPGAVRGAVDGLITGFHEPSSSHLALLLGLAGQRMVRGAYAEAVRRGYLWHEFGDSHLLLWERRARIGP